MLINNNFTLTNIILTTICNETWLNHTVKNLHLEEIAKSIDLNNITSTFCSTVQKTPQIQIHNELDVTKITSLAMMFPLVQLMARMFPNR